MPTELRQFATDLGIFLPNPEFADLQRTGTSGHRSPLALLTRRTPPVSKRCWESRKGVYRKAIDSVGPEIVVCMTFTPLLSPLQVLSCAWKALGGPRLLTIRTFRSHLSRKESRHVPLGRLLAEICESGLETPSPATETRPRIPLPRSAAIIPDTPAHKNT